MAVFERSAYLELRGRIVAVASAGLEQGPLSICLEREISMRGIAAGAAAELSRGLLRVDGIEIDLRDAAIWNPRLPRAEAATPRAREVVREETLAGAPSESIAGTVLGSPGAGGPPAGALAAALADSLLPGLSSIARLIAASGDGKATADATTAVSTKIAGLGPGLTPSGDDLLIGIAHALTVLPCVQAQEGLRMRDLLIGAAIPRTSRISAAYLEAARVGCAAVPWHALLHALRGPEDGLRRAVRRLLRVGETSGADALAGFCWAWSRLEG